MRLSRFCSSAGKPELRPPEPGGGTRGHAADQGSKAGRNRARLGWGVGREVSTCYALGQTLSTRDPFSVSTGRVDRAACVDKSPEQGVLIPEFSPAWGCCPED